MADTFKGIITADGKKRRLPYANVLEAPVSDKTLSEDGGFADAKVTGDNFAKAKAETDSLKGDIANSRKAIDEIADKKITKFYTNNLGETTLNDSDNGKIQDMMMYGKSEQKSYSGKNLFKAKNEGIITVTCDGLLLNGTIDTHQFISFTIPAGAYFIGDMTGEYSIHLLINNNDVYLKDVGAITFETDTRLEFYIIQGTYSNGLLKPYIVEGSNPMETYEPYVGGIPSPNPDYPQEIKSVVNPVVKVCGGKYRNLLTDFQWDWLKNQEWNDNNHIVTIGTHYDDQVLCIWDLTNLNSSGLAYAIMCGTNTEGYKGYHNSFYDNYVILHSKTNIRSFMGVYDIPLVDSEETLGLPNSNCSATLPYTLNAIPVSSGGNVTIDGQEYIADYVDVEKKQLVRMVGEPIISSVVNNGEQLMVYVSNKLITLSKVGNRIGAIVCDKLIPGNVDDMYNGIVDNCISNNQDNSFMFRCTTKAPDVKTATSFIRSCRILSALYEPTEIDLTDEEVQAFKELQSYYPTTNVTVTSDELDGASEFLYPCSLENFVEYIKEQTSDTRDFIYDMSDIADLAFINSQYAEILAELALEEV